jgi:hypothetical protein
MIGWWRAAETQHVGHIEARGWERKLRRYVGAILIVGIAVAAIGCAPVPKVGSSRTPAPDSAPATVGADAGVDPLWSDGLETLGAHREGDTIPDSEWAPAVRELNPLRVYVHGVDIVIVLEDSPTQEAGKYIVSGLSSKTLQQGDGGFTFSPDPEAQRAARRAEVYDFTRGK